MKIKNENAITIVTLVITIIIMLILVGVVLYFSIGENGLIKVSKEAAKKYQNAQVDEEVALVNYENKIRGYTLEENEINKDDSKNLNKEDLNSMFYPNKSMILSLAENQATIPRNGWLYIYFWKRAQGNTFSAYRNNLAIFFVACPTVDTGASTYIPVKEGDLIKVDNSSYFTLRLDYYEKESINV